MESTDLSHEFLKTIVFFLIFSATGGEDAWVAVLRAGARQHVGYLAHRKLKVAQALAEVERRLLAASRALADGQPQAAVAG